MKALSGDAWGLVFLKIAFRKELVSSHRREQHWSWQGRRSRRFLHNLKQR